MIASRCPRDPELKPVPIVDTAVQRLRQILITEAGDSSRQLKEQTHETSRDLSLLIASLSRVGPEMKRVCT